MSAIRAIVSHQHFDGGFLQDLPRITSGGGIVMAFVTTTTLIPSMVTLFAETEGLPPNLKFVTIEIAEWDFEKAVAPKFAWEEELETEDMKAFTRHHELWRFSGLQGLRIKDTGIHHARTKEQRSIWKANVRKLEAFIRALATRVTSPEQKPRQVHTAALYHGSRVSLINSTLLEDEVGSHEVPYQTHFTKLQIRDLPDNVEDLMALLSDEGEKVMELIRELKQRDRYSM